jgi:DNA-binding NarL/FixJ family response regulator
VALEPCGLGDANGGSGLGKPRTILIADDSASVRAVIRESIERETPFKICGEATDGIDAIHKARELKPDLVILDVVMPRLNGLEAAAILRHSMSELRIVLISMYGDDLGEGFAAAIRVDAVLSKSDGIIPLIESVQNLLAD